MNMTQEELVRKLKANPHLKVSSRQPNAVNQSIALGEPKKPFIKYRNTKLYEYANGAVLDDKTHQEYGAIVGVFDSIKEFERWSHLKFLQNGNLISELSRQTVLTIQEAFVYKGQRIAAIQYKADFVYLRKGADSYTVEDVKPFDEETGKYRFTKDFILKWKLLKARYPDYDFVIY